MSGETKKRLLLSKWRETDLRAELAEVIDERDELQAELDERDSEALRVLELVKYWLHDGLVMHKLVSNPRDILRKVEEVL